MIHGPSIAVTREAAKEQIMFHFVAVAEADKTPPTLRAAYVAKAQQAALVLAGGESVNRCIEREAEMRGYTPFEMATIIDWMAGVMLETEVRRMATNVAIEKAADEAEIVAILASEGLALSLKI